ncbi:MAG: pyruvate ferredoxin oxidoreductase, partial [Thermosulfidibacteraceae bacterium]
MSEVVRDLKAFAKALVYKNAPKEEYFKRGHRACQGCAPALAIRYILKAAGPNTIVVNATGCMEIISSPFPYTSWGVPWIHVAFENVAAVASGVEAAIKV